MRMSDGSTSANVAVALPSTAMVSLKPALCTAVYPQYVAEFIPIGPGVIWLMATMFVNSAEVSHWCLTTVSVCMSDSIPYPPPNPKRPIWKNVMKSSKNIIPLVLTVFRRDSRLILRR